MATQAPLVYEDLESFPEDNVRREILGGELYVTPSPVPRHQKIVGRLGRALDDYAESVGGEAYASPLDTVLSAQNVVEPDAIYIGPDRMHTIGLKAILGAPSLVVEVLSPGTAATDRGRKRSIYARFGIPEYWIVDSDAKTIERCSDPQGDLYRTAVMFDSDMPAATLPNLVLSFEKIFA